MTNTSGMKKETCEENSFRWYTCKTWIIYGFASMLGTRNMCRLKIAIYSHMKAHDPSYSKILHANSFRHASIVEGHICGRLKFEGSKNTTSFVCVSHTEKERRIVILIKFLIIEILDWFSTRKNIFNIGTWFEMKNGCDYFVLRVTRVQARRWSNWRATEQILSSYEWYILVGN